jgi:hypothetical protein
MQTFKEYFYQVFLETIDMIDKQYFEAIKNPDEQTLRKLVDQKAVENGYNIGPVYRGGSVDKKSLWFTEDPKEAEKYGIVQSFYLKMEKYITVKGGFNQTFLSDHKLFPNFFEVIINFDQTFFDQF